MRAAIYSFTIEQGSTLEFEIRYKDIENNPIDLTGYSGEMQIRSDYSGSGVTYLTLSSNEDNNYSKQTDNSFLSFIGKDLDKPTTSGSIGIYVGYELTDQLTFSEPAYYDIEITKDNIRTRILEGRINISRQVTTS
jgi:hypothetical protein